MESGGGKRQREAVHNLCRGKQLAYSYSQCIERVAAALTCRCARS
jgi:hypothetical protein